jgi:hypothetical protein
MSQENVDRMREGIESMNRPRHRGCPSRHGSRSPIRASPRGTQGNFVGLSGVRRWFMDLAEPLSVVGGLQTGCSRFGHGGATRRKGAV